MAGCEFPERAWADVTARRQLVHLRGPDAQRFLHNFCTNDIKALAPGRGCEAFLTTDQGRTLAFAFVMCTADGILLDVGRTPASDVIEHLHRYWITEKIELIDATRRFRHFVWLGCELPERVTGHAVAYVEGGFPGTDPCGQLLVPVDAGAEVMRALTEHFGPPLDLDRLERLRIASFWPESGIEVNTDHFPQEFRRDDRAISFTKGCYLGQETVARIHTYGHVNRYLVLLSLSDPPASGAGPIELTSDQQAVGHITSIASDEDGPQLALGFVRRGFEQVGTLLRWRSGPAQGEAEVIR